MKKVLVGLVVCSTIFSLSCGKNIKCDKAQIVHSNATDPVVVVINGKSITESEFENSLSGREKGALLKAKSEMYETKMGVLEDFVFDQLVQEEAKKKNISSDDYLKKEVEDKIKPVQDKDIQAFYNKVKPQIEQSGKQVPPLNDAVKDQIKQQLSMQNTAERRQALVDELFKRNSVTFGLEQPRVTVEPGVYPSKGAENAKVTIIEFSDFQCPFCKKGATTMKEVMGKYSGKVKYYFRDYPLPFHDRAKQASNAARCASDQGKFWEFHDKVFTQQNKLSDEDLVALGKSLKLDMAKYEPCVKEMKHSADIEKDMDAGSNAGVSGTPAYFINGVFLSGALPLKKFEEVINQELKK